MHRLKEFYKEEGIMKIMTVILRRYVGAHARQSCSCLCQPFHESN